MPGPEHHVAGNARVLLRFTIWLTSAAAVFALDALTKAGLPLATPPRGDNSKAGDAKTPGTTVANVAQQAYMADVAAKVVLPMFKARSKPFVLVFWSRDPDGSQHNHGDSLNTVTPGINGPTSLAGIKNADNNLAQLRKALDDLGLLPALRWYVKEYQQKCGIAVELVATGLRERLPTEVETAVYRIVQESLTNTARHGHAQRVWVTVMEEPERLQVIARDDGVGFDAQATLKKPWQDRGLGLAGMQERAMLVNGALAVKSRQGEGVTIEVTIPIPARPALRQAVQLA